MHHHLETDKHTGIFNHVAFNYLKHYFRFYTLPLIIGVVFYFIKEWKSLNIRYFALALSLIIIPSIYVCTYSQDENIGYKNYYIIYLGLITLSCLFIRDFRSISQSICTAFFVFMFGFKTAFNYFQNTLQSYYNNEFYIANDLAQIQNGKTVVYYDTFIDWLTEWQVTYANGKHSKDGAFLSVKEVASSSADISSTFPISCKYFSKLWLSLLVMLLEILS